jgi:hypothetical protein
MCVCVCVRVCVCKNVCVCVFVFVCVLPINPQYLPPPNTLPVALLTFCTKLLEDTLKRNENIYRQEGE